MIFLLGLPGRIAIARQHPEADPVYFMGWIGFLAVLPIWAFRPSDVIDLRYMPRDVRRESDEMIARLGGEAPSRQVGRCTKRGSRAMMAAFLIVVIGLLRFLACPAHSLSRRWSRRFSSKTIPK